MTVRPDPARGHSVLPPLTLCGVVWLILELFQYFSRLYGSTVRSATVCRDVSALDALVYERTCVLEKLLDAYDSLVATGVRPMHRPGSSLCVCQHMVDSINIYAGQLEQLNDSITKALQTPHRKLARGFVTFLASRSVTIASRNDHSQTPDRFVTKVAPNPGEIYWPALSKSPKWKELRYFVVSAIIAVMILFWAVPIIFISSLVSLDSLQKYFPSLREALADHDTARSFVSGFLGSIVYVVFQLLLPTILDALARVEGVASEGSIQRWILRRYFLFIV